MDSAVIAAMNPAHADSPVSAGPDAFAECHAGFQIVFPPESGTTHRESWDADGRTVQMITRDLPGAGFSVTWAEMPASAVLSKGPSRLLHDVFVGRLGATGVVDEQREPLVDGAHALEYAFHRSPETKDEAPGGRVLLVLRGATLFQVAVLGNALTGSRGDAKAFVSSFRLATCDR